MNRTTRFNPLRQAAGIARFTVAALLLSALSIAALGQPAPAGERSASKLVIDAVRVQLSAPIVRVLDGEQRELSELVEFAVKAPGPIPVGATDPVLIVGDRRVSAYRYEASDQLIFVEYEPDRLPERALISLDWSGGTVAAQSTGQRFARSQLKTVFRSPQETQR